MKHGIMGIGTCILDIIKIIDNFPQKNHVCTVTDIYEAVGGNVPNVLINLAALDPELPLYSVGFVGEDQHGQYILSQLQKHGIITDHIKYHDSKRTSQSDIMTLADTGERTVFYYKGASSDLSIDDILPINTNCKIVQIAYLGALETLEQKNTQGQYYIVQALDHFLKQGAKTSIDIVSTNFDDKLIDTIKSCLPYTSYFIANEIESSALHNIELRDQQNKLIKSNVRGALEKHLELGVKECAVMHCPEMAAYLDTSGLYLEIESYYLSNDAIQGAVGAGDAFTAAFLYSMHENIAPDIALRYGHVCARYNLQHKSSVGGVVSLETIKEFLAQN